MQLLTRARLLGVLNLDVEHLGEVLAETVGSTALNGTAGGRDEALDGGGVETTGEFLLFRLDTGDDGNSKKILVHPAVEVENVAHFLVGLGSVQVGSVAFLPQEFSRSQERL